MRDITRRKFVRQALLAGGVSLASTSTGLGSGNFLPKETTAKPVAGYTRQPKKIIVGGGGIAGLSCAYELKKQGHEVVVLEASTRYGGKVYTTSGELTDGLYAEYGAEGFTIPGYEKYRAYLEEFNLKAIPFTHQQDRRTRIGDRWLTREELQDFRIGEAKKVGSFTSQELRFLNSHPLSQLEQLYLEGYLDKFVDEYQPFGVGYDHLDFIPVSDIYKKEGASTAALSLLGGQRSSALAKLWDAYIMKTRQIWNGHERYRIQGGNHLLIQAFAQRLQANILLACEVLGVAQGDDGITVTYTEFGQEKQMDADFFVNALPVSTQKNLLFSPELPVEKQLMFENLAFEQTARIIFQARSQFWLKDDLGINLTFNHPALSDISQVANEVNTSRVALQVRAPAGTQMGHTLAAFHELYPGKASNIDIEVSLIKDWSKEIYTPGCQRAVFPMGQLSKLWPHTTTPVGRMYFVGGYADNRNWGMEAAVNSAHRAAEQIASY